ncbi:MAG TPA: NAD(P)H-hydrate dehydratase [Pyrinomonadaceae bacterium]|jgi:NAD(P)H-hydrate epimerase
MQKVLSATEMREVDRLTTEKYGIPSILLMENAAHASARVITEKLRGLIAGKPFLILCGKGNNGGDGAALARILWTMGYNVVVLLFGKVEETKGDARTNFDVLKKIDSEKLHGSLNFIELEEKDFEKGFHTVFYRRSFSGGSYCCVVDALLGTGLTRPLDEKLSYVTKIISEKQKWEQRKDEYLLVSLDIPSGLNADSNEPIGEKVHADITITFSSPKVANVVAPASSYNGELYIADIGSRKFVSESKTKTFVTEKSFVHGWIYNTKFSSASYKNKRGHALLVAGSNNYAGAAVLAGNAAIVSGVGLVTIATAESAQNSIASRVLPEVMTRGLPETESGAASEEAFDEIDEFIEKSIDAVEIGSGLSSSDDSTRRLVRRLVEQRRTPVVIDADGLTSLAPFDLKGSDELPLVLTPHEGEFLKLLGTKDKEAVKDRVAVGREFAQKHHVILVLKGERSLIAAPDGRVVINPTGNSGLGKAGNGDTLAGIIVGFAAQAAQMQVDMFETTVAAVYLAGLAGDIAAEKYGKRSMLASDVRECLREAFQSITN